MTVAIQTPAFRPSVLAPGIWLYLWPGQGKLLSGQSWKRLEPKALRDTVHNPIGELKLTGVIPQGDLNAPAWCTPERVNEFNEMGLQVAVGLGILRPPFWRKSAKAIISAVEVCQRASFPAVGVSIDGPCGEGFWDGHHDECGEMVTEVLATLAVRNTPFDRFTATTWWAPLSTPRGHNTHPQAPYEQLARLLTDEADLYPMVYGAPEEGLTLQMLQWARDRSQYPSFSRYRVRPTVQAYHRTLKDHLGVLMTEETVVVWDYNEMDTIGHYALRVRAAMERVSNPHFLGGDAIERFQKRKGLKPDGIVGPLTARALGLPPPPTGS